MPLLSNMKRLWVHEILRVFGDRLINEEDMKWLIKQIKITLNNRMEVTIEELFEDLIPSHLIRHVRFDNIVLSIRKKKCSHENIL